MSDYGELDYWQYDVDDPEHWALREIQSPPLDRYDDYDDDDDDYDLYSSKRFSHQVPAYTTHVSESPRSYVKDGRAHSHTHDESLGKHLYQMFLSSDHCDVTLLVGTSKIKAHRLVLMANSDYFNAMFSSTWSEARTGTISFQDNPYVTSNGLAAILDYAYTGSFQVTESTVRVILEAARHFLMPDVTELCEMFVREVQITEANFRLVFEAARAFGMDHDVKRCRQFVKEVEWTLGNFTDVLDFAQASDSAFLRDVLSFVLRNLPLITTSPVCHELVDVMDAGSLLTMVKQDKLCCFTDLPLIEFIMKWVERREDRAHVLAEVLAEINLLCFDEDTLDTIGNTKLIREDEKCKNLVAAAKERLLDITNTSEGEEDLHLVSAGEKGLNFLDITNQTVVELELNDVLFLSTRKSQEMPMNPFIPSARNAPQFMKASSIVAILDAHPLLILAVGDIVFICSGPIQGKNQEWFSLCCSFDPRLSKWTKLACLHCLPEYRRNQLVCVDGEICVIDKCLCACRINIYNFCKDEWRIVKGGPPLANTSIIKAASINGHLYLLSKDAKWEFFSYNPDCGLWEAKKTPFPDIGPGHIDQTPSARGPGRGGRGRVYSNFTPASPARREYFDQECSLVVGEDRLYLFPSRADTPNFFNVKGYSPSADEWTTLRISHSLQCITTLSVAPHAGHIYISACYRGFSRGRVDLQKNNPLVDTQCNHSGVFMLNLRCNSITFVTKSVFCFEFVMLNIPKKSVDMLRERNTPNKQTPESVDVWPAFASMTVR